MSGVRRYISKSFDKLLSELKEKSGKSKKRLSEEVAFDYRMFSNTTITPKKKKKGSLNDIPYAIYILLFVGLIFVLAIFINGQIDDAIIANDNFIPEAKNISHNFRLGYASVIDKGFLFILIGLFVGSLIGAAQIDTDKTLFVLFMILLAFHLFIAAIVTNIYYQFATTPALESTASQLPILGWVFSHFVAVIAVMGLLLGTVLYSKTKLV